MSASPRGAPEGALWHRRPRTSPRARARARPRHRVCTRHAGRSGPGCRASVLGTNNPATSFARSDAPVLA
eukprot:11554275-Alexandrium_andersonii.AAC.1